MEGESERTGHTSGGASAVETAAEVPLPAPPPKKSSKTGSEVATNLPGVSAIRDSKNPGGGTLALQTRVFAAFVESVKSGRFDC
ncbi:DUF397 domain-containing protein [Saccharopolyspora rosea]|uniref:DUF397 domain-containing protein n=1 Tax=Saccharopolyspora rosea TaxID=524884 RepID=UPI0021D97ED1|nr:DUF397 domain-containing protein [Saccharopolyspora rosea]